MADLTNKKHAVINDMVINADALLRAINALEDANEKIVSAGLEMVDADFTGVNQHLSAADFANLRNTATQLKTLITAGHLTNLNKARP